MKSLISIIIPCYNAQSHIERCFASLESQTIGIENLEIIFVNDASTDNTLSLICEFEAKHEKNVIVINCAVNGRQGAARNIGMSYASSKYIGFVDDDDVFEPEMFEIMYQKANTFSCDLVICGFSNLKEADYLQTGTLHSKPAFPQETDAFFEIASEQERLGFITAYMGRSVWNKLYRRDIITNNNICFPEGYIYDDLYFYELVKHYANRIYIVKELFYHHIYREKSASVDISRKYDMLGYLDVQVMLVDELNQRDILMTYKESYMELLMNEAIGVVKTYLLRYGKIESVIIQEIIKRLKPYREDILSNALLQPLLWSTEESFEQKVFKILLQVDI